MTTTMTQGEAIQKQSREAREKLADEVFEWGAINKRIIELAKEGYEYFRVVQKVPVPLRDTKQAKKLTQALKKHGYDVEWVMVSYLSDQTKINPLGVDQEVREMVISWAGRQVSFKVKTALSPIE